MNFLPKAWCSKLSTREREVQDTLWLLLALIWISAPHVATLPLWASVGFVVLLVWRVWLTWQGQQLPGTFLRVVLLLLVTTAVYMEFLTLFGKDAGVTYLVLLLGLKLLEMRAQRDIFVVISLALFVMLTAFFASQSILMALSMSIGLVLLLSVWISMNFVTRHPPYRYKIKLAIHLVVLALPLMAVLFITFPRIQGPLWGLPKDTAAKTGLSDTMAPGSITSLSQSNAIAFRVQFLTPIPPPAQRYWRGPIFGQFDGMTWRGFERPNFTRAPLFFSTLETPFSDSSSQYIVTLEAHHQNWLLLLDLPTQFPDFLNSTVNTPLVNPDLQIIAERPIHSRIQYRADSATRYLLGDKLSSEQLSPWLGLPSALNPRTRALAGQIAAQHPEPLVRVQQILNYFREQEFFYTLQPPALGNKAQLHPVDQFLFDTRRGFCEHYASAFVVLMRSMEIPARVVTGYQGGEINPIDGFLEVRQRDAHAWAEVWLANLGWVRVDPTAAVAPNRIERGLAQALPEAAGLTDQFFQQSWLRYLRFNADALTNAWNQWVLSFNPARQRSLFEKLGIENVDWQVLSMVLLGACSLLLGGMALVMLLKRPKRDALLAQYQRLCDYLGKRGYPRHLHEGPRAYYTRISGELPSPLSQSVQTIITLFEQLRYAQPSAQRAQQLTVLKKLVRRLRK